MANVQRRQHSSAAGYHRFVADEFYRFAYDAIGLMAGLDSPADGVSWRFAPQDTARIAMHLEAARQAVLHATVHHPQKSLALRVREAREDQGLQRFLAKVKRNRA